jgi:hypothetical protein
MVAGAIAGNISAEATTPTSNTFVEATRGMLLKIPIRSIQLDKSSSALGGGA